MKVLVSRPGRHEKSSRIASWDLLENHRPAILGRRSRGAAPSRGRFSRVRALTPARLFKHAVDGSPLKTPASRANIDHGGNATDGLFLGRISGANAPQADGK